LKNGSVGGFLRSFYSTPAFPAAFVLPCLIPIIAKGAGGGRQREEDNSIYFF